MQSPFAPIDGSFKTDMNVIRPPALLDVNKGVKEGGESFQNVFLGFLNNANEAQWHAGDFTKSLTTGNMQNTHEMTIAGAKSEVMLHLVTQIASKLSSTATTLFQMQI